MTGMAFRLKSALLLSVVSLASPFLSSAQGGGDRGFQGATPAPERSARITGAVSGTVFFADTQRPARFATVQLIPVSDGDGSERRGSGGGTGRTALDGTFLIENVPVGEYYVAALATGYVSSTAELASLLEAGVAQADALRRLPLARVAQGAPSTVSVSLERGAVITGSVAWDDGSPAAGVSVAAIAATAQNGNGGRAGGTARFGGIGAGFGAPGGGFGSTDDRGRFRLSGLAPGEYLIRAAVTAPAGGFPGGRNGFERNAQLVVYAPGKLRRTEADTVKVTAAEEHEGISLTLNLRALHTVSGQVSGGDGNAINAGNVRLVDASDSSLSRFGEIAPDGSFSVAYVPAGTYTMNVTARSNRNAEASPGSQGGGTGYRPLQQTLAVADGDLRNLSVVLLPATPASAP